MLNNVNQFMRQQPLSARLVERVRSCSKEDVRAGCNRKGVEGARGGGRLRIGMNAHGAEVVADAPLHQLPRGAVQRASGVAQRALQNSRKSASLVELVRLALQRVLLLTAA